MESQNIEKLNKIFREVFKDHDIIVTPDLTANDVDRWDSLNHLTLISTVEKEFAIKFKLKELIAMKTVGDLMNLIDAKLV